MNILLSLIGRTVCGESRTHGSVSGVEVEGHPSTKDFGGFQTVTMIYFGCANFM